MKKVSIATMGGWKDERWVRGDLGVNIGRLRDDEAVTNFGASKGRLEVFGGWKEGKDSVVWRGNPDSVFRWILAMIFMKDFGFHSVLFGKWLFHSKLSLLVGDFFAINSC